ncbi:mannosyltransferase [Antrihabitans sp. YC2-6]|uniref:mannosyltransferase n=1 Tax=Antrihabitans sp. YC2-6 TaxID=2799498 RepID=UPI0027DDB6CE|nr:mannosyltransferase [Antrihabitans sp. YC2-6]
MTSPAGAAMLLAIAVCARLAWVLLTPNGMNLVDLHVYVDCSAALLSGDLYDCTYADQTPEFPLPFTYPPFAALVFFPLHYLPFGFIGIAWLLLTIAALYKVVDISLDLVVSDVDPARRRAWAMLWTAGGMWLEPMRTTLDYGQVNVFLVLGAIVAVRSTRWWVSGFLLGFIAGIKLTPAIAGLYFVARRRWATVVASAAVFALTVGLSYLAIGGQAHKYFGTLLGDADRIGPVGSVTNQSLRGTLSRLLGHDVETGTLWFAAVAIAVVLAVLAWRALAPDDLLGTLLVVQMLGLLISPISWAHHWVWLIPLLIWLFHGPYRNLAGARVLAWFWLLVTAVGVPWVLGFAQGDVWEFSRSGLISWLSTAYVAGALATFVWIIERGWREAGATPADRPSVQATRRDR